MSLKHFLLALLAVVALATPSFGDYPKPPPHEHKPDHKPPLGAPMGGEKPPRGMPPKGGKKPLPEHKPPMGAPMGGEIPPMGMPPKGEEKPPKTGGKPPSHGHYPGHSLMENVQDFKKPPPRKVMPPMAGPSKQPYGLHKPKSPPHSL